MAKFCTVRSFLRGPLFICIKILILTLSLSWLYRFIFFISFGGLKQDFLWTDFFYSLYLGLKFDFRLSILFALPFFILWMVPFMRTYFRLAKQFWISVYFIAYIGLLSIHVLDYVNFSYLQKRFVFSAFRFIKDFNTSMEVFLNYYPVVLMVLVILFCIGLIFYILKRIFNSTVYSEAISKKRVILIYSVFSVIAIFGIYGKIGFPPALRWSEVYFIENSFLRQFALNPVLYLYDSSQWKPISYNYKRVKESYPEISQLLGSKKKNQKKDKMLFKRLIKGTPQGQLNTNMNLIVVIMESLATHKTSLLNPMDSTPFLKKIAKEGIYFPHFYSSTMGTARGIFSILCSIPDPVFGRKGTASRNNEIGPQNSAINALLNHNKFYFLGGSLNWAQMRSLIKRTVPDIKIIEEGDFETERTDVWGLSDLDLVIEADKVFSKQKKPFVGILQFASFHRPFSLPKDVKGFTLENHPDSVLKKHGFLHLKEYNSLRFSDYSLGYLVKLARESDYLDNTLIVVLGDHGLPIREGGEHIPRFIKDFNLGYFTTPFVLYSPKNINPKIHSQLSAHIDVLPTSVAALGQSFMATGLGINLLNETQNRKYISLQIDSDITLLYDDKVMTYNLVSNTIHKAATLNPYSFFTQEEISSHENWSENAKNFYETIKYMVFHNQPILKSSYEEN